mmetsp:Transcript_24777/g.93725  ORF Transcript_24777/g.93725 Transcript_24777/m.93725 type:complete len:279 (-) Transcript_24777:32-868(-)
MRIGGSFLEVCPLHPLAGWPRSPPRCREHRTSLLADGPSGPPWRAGKGRPIGLAASPPRFRPSAALRNRALSRLPLGSAAGAAAWSEHLAAAAEKLLGSLWRATRGLSSAQATVRPSASLSLAQGRAQLHAAGWPAAARRAGPATRLPSSPRCLDCQACHPRRGAVCATNAHSWTGWGLHGAREGAAGETPAPTLPPFGIRSPPQVRPSSTAPAPVPTVARTARLVPLGRFGAPLRPATAAHVAASADHPSQAAGGSSLPRCEHAKPSSRLAPAPSHR